MSDILDRLESSETEVRLYLKHCPTDSVWRKVADILCDAAARIRELESRLVAACGMVPQSKSQARRLAAVRDEQDSLEDCE